MKAYPLVGYLRNDTSAVKPGPKACGTSDTKNREGEIVGIHNLCYCVCFRPVNHHKYLPGEEDGCVIAGISEVY